MQKITFTNEKGNAIAAVRSAVRAQAMEHFCDVAGLQIGANGNLYTQIAVDEATNQPIYATLSLAISMQDPTVAKEKPVKNVEKEPVEVPELF